MIDWEKAVDWDKIAEGLDRARARKNSAEKMKLTEQLKAADANYLAYVDGAFDAIKRVKAAVMAAEREDAAARAARAAEAEEGAGDD